jgi:hypothetical protein
MLIYLFSVGCALIAYFLVLRWSYYFLVIFNGFHGLPLLFSHFCALSVLDFISFLQLLVPLGALRLLHLPFTQTGRSDASRLIVKKGEMAMRCWYVMCWLVLRRCLRRSGWLANQTTRQQVRGWLAMWTAGSWRFC